LIDKFNNKYVASTIEEEDSNSLSDKTSLYLYKYNEQNELILKNRLITSLNLKDFPITLATDGKKNLFFGVNFVNELTLDDSLYISNGNVDALLIKTNLNGDLIFVKQIGGECDDAIRSIFVQETDYIYLGGYFGDLSPYSNDNFDCNLTFENKQFETDEYSNGNYFLIKLNINGDLIWHNTGGGGGFDELHNIRAKSNDIYFTCFSTSLTDIKLNDYVLNLPYGKFTHVLVAKANVTTGEVTWANYASTEGALNLVYPFAVQAGTSAITVVGRIETNEAGQSNHLVIKGANSLIWESGQSDYFLINYSETGNVNWSIKGENPGRDLAVDLAIDKKNNHYLTGYGSSDFVFVNDTIFSQGGNDIFVACYNQNGEEQWIKTAGGKGNDTANSIALDQGGRIYVCGGTSSHPVTFGDITVEPPHPNNVYLARLSDDPILSILPINSAQNQTPVYPNPAANRLWLQQTVSQHKIKSMLLYDVAGNLVTQNFKQSYKDIDVQHLATGIYFLNITYSNGEQQVVKWCKQ